MTRKTLGIIIGVIVVVIVVGTGVYFLTAGPAGEEAEGISVALCNGWFGNQWRTQQANDFKTVAEYYKGKGWISDYYIRNSGPDVSDQIADIRSLIAQGVDVLVINANSPTALNPVIKEATDAGILVYCADQHVTSPHAYNVIMPQDDWFARDAQWICEQLDGKGDIIVVNGMEGHPASTLRWEGAQKVLEEYPDINVVKVINGGWSPDQCEKRFAPVLASYAPGEIDGILSQDSQPLGILRAYEVAGREPPLMTGDYQIGFLRKYDEMKEEGWDFKWAQGLNTPAYCADALKIGVRTARGWELDHESDSVDTERWPGVTTWIPMPPMITYENVPELLEKYNYKSDAYLIDWILPEDFVEETYF